MQPLRQLLAYLDLRRELEEIETIHEEIGRGVVFRGTNLYILAIAILIASIGLNINSSAVIIGAMLISPLMGPIIGMGYSIATYDFVLLRQALRNYGFAVIASLITSFLYFTLSPVSTAHSEILARTSPTIYDVLIALLGGTAGMLALSSKQKGNVLPGAAIATALMPPLCTAGYGIASWQPAIFTGAFYLFTINTVFIAFSGVVVAKLLGFPITTVVDDRQKAHVRQILWAVIVLTSLPSIYFGYLLVQQERFMRQATQFIAQVSQVDGSYLIRNEVQAKRRQIILIYGGTPLDSALRKRIYASASASGLMPESLTLRHNQREKPGKEENGLQEQLAALNWQAHREERLTDSLQRVCNQVLRESQALYPGITALRFSPASRWVETDTLPDCDWLLVRVSPTARFPASTQHQLQQWLKTRLGSDSLRVVWD